VGIGISWADRPAPLLVSIITSGAPTQLSGGHLYHHHLAALAPTHDARVEFVSVPPWRDPLTRAGGVPVIDSITAWSVLPWTWRHQGPVAAIVHQPPGGIDRRRLPMAFQRALDRACYRRCRLLVAPGAAFARTLVAEHGLDPARVRTIEPGCDVPAPAGAPPDLRAGRRLAALCVANWLPGKGVLELAAAIARLEPDRMTLHLVGRDDVDPSYTAAVRSRLAAGDLRDRVVVHGAVAHDRVGALYAGADIFVLPSAGETYGTAFAEALAAGLPVVGWATGNVTRLVTDGADGVLIPPGDVGALSAALDRLASDDARRVELAAGARRRGAELPTWADTAAAFFGAVRELVAERG
jgi:glycosyltransferase involved in cell wall biosynthesis